MNDTDRAKDALQAIPPDLPRDDWVRAGMAAHAAGLDFDTFDGWSAQADNYDQRDAQATWRSFKPGKGVGAGTLFKLAAENGWRMDGKQRQHMPAQAPRKAVEPPRKPAPGMSTAEVWERCIEASPEHGYIVAKQGKPDGLRVVPADDPLRIAGLSMAGALVVPVIPLGGGEPVSLQFVATPEQAASWKADGKPSKLNLTGAPMAGVFLVGELVPGDPVLICEGIGQAWACWTATGCAAVACFGSSRMRSVATELRERDASARLVLIADVGKEDEAQAIAKEVQGSFVSMPDGWPQNADVNDLMQRDGVETLDVLLGKAKEIAEPIHPLAQFVDFNDEPMAPRWVIPGFIGHGVAVIAGAHGVGKTTALLPLAMVAAGLHALGDPLAPRHWRHVVYIVEDVEQARRILAGIIQFGGMGFDMATVRERLHIVEARRLEPAYVAQVGPAYKAQFSRTVDGVEVLPLVVIDTKSAVLALDNENDNSEASRAMAALKQGFECLPVWLIGHVAKQTIGRADLASLSTRGGSAFEADANQVLYLVKEDEQRYLVRGKTRFEANWTELEISSATATTTALDEFGNAEPLTLRWAHLSPPTQSRKESRQEGQEAADKAEAAALREDVRDAVQVAWQGGFPLNREGVAAKVKRRKQEVVACIENLLNERWLHEVAIPAKERTNPKRSAFLVNLTTEEHEAAVRGEGMPQDKQEIPESWKKAPIPSVPEIAPENEQASPC